MNRGGFSFFVLILVLLIIGSFVIVSYPYFNKELKEARNIASAISIKDSVTNKDITDIINPPIDIPTLPDIPSIPQVDESEFYLPNVYRYGRTLLNATQQAAYDEVLSQIIKYDTNNIINIDGRPALIINLKSNINETSLRTIIRYIDTDAPEAFHISSLLPRVTKVDSQNNVREFYVYVFASYQSREKYINTLSQIINNAKPILAKINTAKNDIDKIKIAHDELIKLVSYGGMSSVSAAKIVGAFIDNKVICDGYSRALLFLLQRAFLKGIYTTGYAQFGTQDEPQWGLHAWNLINYNNTWYYVDSTWDDPILGSINPVKWEYFMKGTIDFLKNHSYNPTSSLKSQSYPTFPNASTISLNGTWN